MAGLQATQDRTAQIQDQVKNITRQVDDTVRDVATESFVLETEAYAEQMLNRLVLKNQRRKDNNELRKEYAKKAYGLAATSVLIWASIFIACAIAKGAADISLLSDQALIALTAGATVNVLAAFLAIVKGLFPSKA